MSTKESGSGVDATLTRHGGLSYLEIPAVEPSRSAAFYEQVVGWNVSGAATDQPKFVDATGHLIGRFVTGRAISREPGLMAYIYVTAIDEAIGRVAPHGGEVVTAPYAEGDVWVARIRDPAGNVIGLWQQAPR
jgi:predicted enzyme related to lactoylglutathione lyase